nr:hypothetical protein [Tanacetum cinerariifolium]
MGLDEIPGFAKGYEVGKFKTKIEVQVDRKLESEVSGLQRELGKQMNDESGKLRKQMDDESGKFNKRETDAKIRILEGVLNGIQWLIREEFDKFVEEFKGWKGREMGLDEIRAFAKGVVKKEIKKLAKGCLEGVLNGNEWLMREEFDKFVEGVPAFTKAKHFEAYVGGSGACRVTEWLKGRSVRGDSVKALQLSFGQPGEYFPLKGESGFVELKIRITIVPKTITLEHVVDKLKSKVF